MNSKILTIIICSAFIPLPLMAANSVLINEIAWMGTAVSANDEWLELFNATTEEIDLTDWRLEADDDAPKITLTGKIPAGGFYLLERTDDETVSGMAADQIYTGSLGNTGEWLKLFDSQGKVVDEIKAAESWPGGDNDTKATLERTAAGIWQTSATSGGTPKAANSGGLSDNPPPANNDAPILGPGSPTVPADNPVIVPEIKRNDLVINEIFSNPAGPDTAGEFLELKNAGLNIINLEGFKITNSAAQSFVITNLTMHPKALAVFFRPQSGLILTNEKDKITLYSAAGKIIDQKSYENFAENSSLQRTANDQWCVSAPTAREDTACEPEVFPVPKIFGPKTAAAGQILIFDASDSYDAKNRPLQYFWDFGDGKTATGINTYQIYGQGGTYEIKMTTAANEVASSSARLKIKILGNEPAAAPAEPPRPETSTDTTTTPASMAPAVLAALPNIFISEFLADPDADKNQDEFIEIVNGEDYPLDLSGWQLDDDAASGRPYVLPAGTVIKPGQRLAFYKTDTHLALNNNGDIIQLSLPAGQIIDQAEYEKSTKGTSYVLDGDFIWQETETPTPGEINVLNQKAENTAAAVTSSPQVLGSQTAAWEPAAATTTSGTGKNKYLYSALAAVFALGLGAAIKLKKNGI